MDGQARTECARSKEEKEKMRNGADGLSFISWGQKRSLLVDAEGFFSLSFFYFAEREKKKITAEAFNATRPKV